LYQSLKFKNRKAVDYSPYGSSQQCSVGCVARFAVRASLALVYFSGTLSAKDLFRCRFRRSGGWWNNSTG